MKKIYSVAKGLEERIKFSNSTKIDLKTTKSAIRSLQGSSSVGKKIIGAGIILTLAFPDPFTDLAGIPLIALGTLIERRKSIGIRDVEESLSSTISGLKEFKTSMNRMKEIP